MSEGWYQLVNRKLWEQARRRTVERVGDVCEVRGPSCTITATEGDHISL